MSHCDYTRVRHYQLIKWIDKTSKIAEVFDLGITECLRNCTCEKPEDHGINLQYIYPKPSCCIGLHKWLSLYLPKSIWAKTLVTITINPDAKFVEYG